MRAEFIHENIKKFLKPKSTEEIADVLEFIEQWEDLSYGEYYYVLELGLNQWTELAYMGTRKNLYTFVSPYMGDDFKIEYTFSELIEAINDKEIAKMPKFLR